MESAITYPLNPVDSVFLAMHESLRQRGYCGLSVMLIADVEGPLNPSELAQGLKRLGQTYPALSAHVRHTPFLRRPYWHVSGDAPLEDAIEYQQHEIKPRADDAEAPLRQALDDPVDPTSGPQLRLVHVRQGQNRHRLGLRWAHPLMDLEGGHLLFRELHAAMCGRPPTLGQDPRAVAPRPYGWGFPRSFLRAWQGRLRYAYHDGFRQARLVATPDTTGRRCDFIRRLYGPDVRRRFEAAARRRMTPGRCLYTRALMVAMGRAYRRMAGEGGRPRGHYLFSQALPVPRPGPRPGVHGNHITVPCMVFKASDLEDWPRADAVATRQFTDYSRKKRQMADWEMYSATARWPFPLTRWIVTHRAPRLAASFTGYRFDESFTELGSAKITNLSAVVSGNCHPGWLLDFTTFRDSMTLSLTFFEDYLDRAGAAKFLDRLEAEMLE